MTGKPIEFIGTGEELDGLEEFHPERLAGRILGMGDVVSLVKRAQQKFDQEEVAWPPRPSSARASSRSTTSRSS